MGQANARGTREQRVAASKERDYARREAARRAELERLAAMTPAEREAESARKHLARMIACKVLGEMYAVMAPRRRGAPPNTSFRP